MTSSKITDLLPCPNKKGFYDVYADGELILTVSEDAVLQAELKVGKTLDTQYLEQIEYAIGLTRAKAKAYNYLSYGDMSKTALFKKLVRYGFSEEISDNVCVELENSGYIDDERYARQLASYLADTKLYGPRRIKQELAVKGIESAVASDAIAELETDFEQSIRALTERKFHTDTSDRKQVSKLFASLVRYGYEYDMISSALSDLEEQYE